MRFAGGVAVSSASSNSRVLGAQRFATELRKG
jgi:hypothetical protein